MGKLFHAGADPAKLYEQFREANEERESMQEDTVLNAQQELTDVHAPEISVREYRRARNAERFLVVESELPDDELTYRDYRASRQAEQRGERPASFASYQSKEKE